MTHIFDSLDLFSIGFLLLDLNKMENNLVKKGWHEIWLNKIKNFDM